MVQGRRLKQDLIVNFAFTIVKAFALLWVIRIASIIFTPEMLGIFLFTRRLSNTGANLFQLGMSQTLRRYLSINADNFYTKQIYVRLAVCIWIGLVIIFLPVVYWSRNILATWLFPNIVENGSLVFWAFVLLLGTVIHFIANSTLFAERRMISANLNEMMNVSGFLLIALLWQGRHATPAAVLCFQALTITAMSVWTLVAYLFQKPQTSWSGRTKLDSTMQIFVRYGLPRGVIPFLEMSIMSMGLWFLRMDIKEVGFLTIALVLVQMIQTAVVPLAQVSSVVIARLVGKGDELSIRQGIRLSFGTILYATVLLMSMIYPWKESILTIWLSDAQIVKSVMYYFNILFWCIFPLSFFYGLRDIIEMYWFRPFNLYTLLIGFVLHFIVYMILFSSFNYVMAVLISMIAAFWSLGILTIFWIRSYIKPINYWGLYKLTTVSILLILLNMLTAFNLGIIGLVYSVFYFLICLVIIFYYPSPFIRSFQGFVWRSEVT